MKELILVLLFIPFMAVGQTTSDITGKLGENSLKIVDSVKISDKDFSKIDFSTIADITILYHKSAMKIYGKEAKDGAILCETKNYVRKRFIDLLRRKSTIYDSLYNISQSDSTFEYILNNKVELTNFEGDFSSMTINNDLFISVEILSADDLRNNYNITGKRYGVLIHSKYPSE